MSQKPKENDGLRPPTFTEAPPEPEPRFRAASPTMPITPSAAAVTLDAGLNRPVTPAIMLRGTCIVLETSWAILVIRVRIIWRICWTKAICLICGGIKLSILFIIWFTKGWVSPRAKAEMMPGKSWLERPRPELMVSSMVRAGLFIMPLMKDIWAVATWTGRTSE